jgi:hypothetical protein
MKRSKFTEERIIGILREQEAGAKTAVLADYFEPVSVRTVTLPLIPRKGRATRRERRCGSA